MRYTLSGDHAISDKPFVCPFKLRISSPENGDHILATLSAAAQKAKKKKSKRRVSDYSCVTLHAKAGGDKTESLPHEANKVPSGLNLTEDIDIVCPRSVYLSS